MKAKHSLWQQPCRHGRIRCWIDRLVTPRHKFTTKLNLILYKNRLLSLIICQSWRSITQFLYFGCCFFSWRQWFRIFKNKSILVSLVHVKPMFFACFESPFSLLIIWFIMGTFGKSNIQNIDLDTFMFKIKIIYYKNIFSFTCYLTLPKFVNISFSQCNFFFTSI